MKTTTMTLLHYPGDRLDLLLAHLRGLLHDLHPGHPQDLPQDQEVATGPLKGGARAQGTCP